MPAAVEAAGQGARFVSGLRRFLRGPVPTVEEALGAASRVLPRRGEVFGEMLDELVWSVPASPYRALLLHAGFDAGAVRRMVAQLGLEGALEQLRDKGVYVSYDEYQGKVPIQRGSLELAVKPSSFFNPRVAPDYMGSTGASRSSGLPVTSSFANLRHGGHLLLLRMATWGVAGAPAALWFPVLPSSAGINVMLRLAATGHLPERWFSQVDPAVGGIAVQKRLANQFLPLAGALARVRLPRPEHVSPADPGPVLEWAQEVLARHGRAYLGCYASSGVRLAGAATAAGVSLEGLVLSMTGEPVTTAKLDAVRRSDATPGVVYAFTQKGTVGINCGHLDDEEMHLMEHEAAVIHRPVLRPDGVEVPALLWTNLERATRTVLLNLENDDYADIDGDAPACPCLLGQLGFRTRLRNVRGISKVVAGGITVPGELFERVVDAVLPVRFGGTPSDFQFVEREAADGSATVTLVVDPGIRAEDDELRAAVAAALRATENGILADEVWRTLGGIRVTRATPRTTASGKILPYEVERR